MVNSTSMLLVDCSHIVKRNRLPLCKCGCGEKVNKKHSRYISGHNNRNWRQPLGKKYNTAGYVMIYKPGHPRADLYGYVYEHILIAEAILGRFLKDKENVHHFNKSKGDNNHTNLIICQDWQYHMILHARQKAYDNCGFASWRKCIICKNYDDPLVMAKHSKFQFYHRECISKKQKEEYKARKNEK